MVVFAAPAASCIGIYGVGSVVHIITFLLGFIRTKLYRMASNILATLEQNFCQEGLYTLCFYLHLEIIHLKQLERGSVII